jgi:hypothetical protein
LKREREAAEGEIRSADSARNDEYFVDVGEFEEDRDRGLFTQRALSREKDDAETLRAL